MDVGNYPINLKQIKHVKENKLIPQLHPLPETVNAGRLPTWNIRKLCHRACPACEKDMPTPLIRRPDKLLVHRCSNCDMIYLADIPNEEDIEIFYNSYGEFKKYDSSAISFYQRILAQSNMYINILEKTGGINGMSVCEIGCSHGNFLELIRCRGGYAFGLEIDNDARKTLALKNISNDSALKNAPNYDVICLLQVMEHLVSPHTMIAAVSNALKTDGRLLISVPNGDEVSIAGLSWVGFRVDFEHLNYFTLKSMADMLLRHNLYVEQFWVHYQPGIQRPVHPANQRTPFIAKIGKKLTGLYNRFLAPDTFYNGSFVLTILARKV